ncbi:hypothetical protein HD554DRAFT_1520133 [Boletus coccyginus]|nr:hypothetical protein HD554DRAFT_1520133 [Boletus coccyginus]
MRCRLSPRSITPLQLVRAARGGTFPLLSLHNIPLISSPVPTLDPGPGPICEPNNGRLRCPRSSLSQAHGTAHGQTPSVVVHTLDRRHPVTGDTDLSMSNRSRSLYPQFPVSCGRPQRRQCRCHSPLVIARPVPILPPLLIRVAFSIGRIPSPHRDRAHLHRGTVAVNVSCSRLFPFLAHRRDRTRWGWRISGWSMVVIFQLADYDVSMPS